MLPDATTHAVPIFPANATWPAAIIALCVLVYAFIRAWQRYRVEEGVVRSPTNGNGLPAGCKTCLARIEQLANQFINTTTTHAGAIAFVHDRIHEVFVAVRECDEHVQECRLEVANKKGGVL